MEIKETASAGTIEKCDCLVTVSKGEGDIKINLSSKVLYQYGDSIRNTILQTLKKLDVNDVTVDVEDMGAFEYVIVARLEAAIYRSQKQMDQIPWGDLLHE
ncbi:citrate lyase acyl carrier protein [Solobacterium sp.]|jgi:citrate lyase acyl carrier protein|uniref:citrate lyase acyl carrier protein n=1 Tax=Solobacterium sp. TaxID=2060878 RepID=UPI001CAEA36A|nr:citrate lyase acyl carrier protein [Solobacterium sp.]MBF1077007.1 citrate lyase acyl carrier protein [Solobacterium sp.]MBF1082835.1 citrate lyase acyl carrier protein [Solobacterium sp.]MBF1098719.1 citrate lyase acyl carrier protein [Solobacterium sp.]MBF1104519.1 citrate lyase acyl carrier protein [Solobacterium sp.]MBF1108357.1 citrate lyase acyl carrier protein [Solobacterium sp.]